MSKYFNDYNLHVITNVISGVETYGQIYSDERNWGDFTEAYAATPNEVSITIGWAANYGEEARKLLKLIQKDYPNDFKNNDKANIASDIKKSFTTPPYYQPSKTSNKAKSIINIIKSQGGKKSQDKLFAELIQSYLDHAINYGINKNNIKALMMWCELQHLGGPTPVKRIFGRCGTNPTMDQIMDALKKDQTNGNTAEVGDKMFQSRHDCCYKWINQYAKNQTTISASKEENQVVVINGIDFSKYYGQISNSGSDENGTYANGYAGDQTRHEWEIRTWYNRPWNCVLRHPNKKVRELIAELSIQAANNNLIGYDQWQRDTYWQQLQLNKYRPSLIKVACESDCSAGVIANTKAAGYLLNISQLKNLTATYTGNMRTAYRNAGFQVLTDYKYLNGYDYLVPGDILLNDEHHTATNLGIGIKSNYNNQKTDQMVIIYPTEQKPTTSSNENGGLNKTPIRTGVVIADALNVRTWAGTENPNIKSYPILYKGNRIDICDTIKDTQGNDWYYIRIAGKIYGFVSSYYIQKD